MVLEKGLKKLTGCRSGEGERRTRVRRSGVGLKQDVRAGCDSGGGPHHGAGCDWGARGTSSLQ